MSFLFYVSDDWQPNRFVSNKGKKHVFLSKWNVWQIEQLSEITDEILNSRVFTWEIFFLDLDFPLWSDADLGSPNYYKGCITWETLVIELLCLQILKTSE